MGLFGGVFKGIGKLAGKVAKVGLSKLTHGASDQVLKVLKGRGQVKQVLAKGPALPMTNNEVATVRKLLPVQRLPGLGENTVLNAAGAIGNVPGYKGKAGWKGKSKSKAGRSAPAVVAPSFSRSSAKTGSTRRGSGSSSKPKRSLPPALRERANRMRALAAAWRAEGKPGRWIDYVKANG